AADHPSRRHVADRSGERSAGTGGGLAGDRRPAFAHGETFRSGVPRTGAGIAGVAGSSLAREEPVALLARGHRSVPRPSVRGGLVAASAGPTPAGVRRAAGAPAGARGAQERTPRPARAGN